MQPTIEQLDSLRNYLENHHIPKGLGTKEGACSIAAINLCLTGKLTDDIPECMSKVIGRWIITIQDAMPDNLRNSKKWKELLPLTVGTGRKKEKERAELIMQWMWNQLTKIQYIADKYGFGVQWKTMTTKKTTTAAARAARAADDADTDACATSADVAACAASAAAAYTADAADAAYAADAASAAAAAYADAAYARADIFWDKANPCKLLKDLISIK